MFRHVPVCLCLFQIGSVTSATLAQFSGTYRTVPGATAIYEFHRDALEMVELPIDVTATFPPGAPTTMLTATIHKPIISVDENGEALYPIGEQFPLVVSGTSSNGRDFSGNLLDTQYLFQWEFEPIGNNELLWNGHVFWAGGRYEDTTITNVRMVRVNATLPGDYNQDHVVAAADYTIWRDTLTETGNNLAADGNGSGAVDGADYELWRAHFGETVVQGRSVGNVVPEPRTITLLLVSVLIAPALARHYRGFPQHAR
jgi:hypothetical protein